MFTLCKLCSLLVFFVFFALFMLFSFIFAFVSIIFAFFSYFSLSFVFQLITTQQEMKTIQGQKNTWFCGAWNNYGFHEDGLTSGLKVRSLQFAFTLLILFYQIAEAIGAKCPFEVKDSTHARKLKSKL